MVRQIKKILFTSDLSETSVAVFEEVVALASQIGASIAILHVIEDGSSGRPLKPIYLIDQEVYEKIRRESQQNVKNVLIGKQRAIPEIQNALMALCDETCTGHAESVNIDNIEVRYGNAADIILEVADSLDCDVIAIGFKKKGSFLKMLMGGAGKKVIQESKKPIYLIPAKKK